MKRYKHIITIVLFVAVVAITIVAWGALNAPNENSDPAADAQLSSDDTQTTLQDTHLSLSSYSLSVDTTKTNEEAFSAMLSSADDILSRYETIQIENDPAIATYLMWSDNSLDQISATDDAVTISTADSLTVDISELSNADHVNKVKYLIFLSFITSEYADSIRIIEPSFDPSQNFDPPPSILMCPDYQALGYETADAYWAAYDSGAHHLEDTPYCISLREECISRLYDPSTENLFETYTEADTDPDADTI